MLQIFYLLTDCFIQSCRGRRLRYSSVSLPFLTSAPARERKQGLEWKARSSSFVGRLRSVCGCGNCVFPSSTSSSITPFLSLSVSLVGVCVCVCFMCEFSGKPVHRSYRIAITLAPQSKSIEPVWSTVSCRKVSTSAWLSACITLALVPGLGCIRTNGSSADSSPPSAPRKSFTLTA